MDAVVDTTHSGNVGRRFPAYGVLGIAVMFAAEILLVKQIRVVGIYFTPVVWTGYILLIDALNLYCHGRSLIVSRTREFLAMMPWSILCWCIFEAYNLHLRNWTYIGLPENPLLRYLGYAWSFATIFPAVLETSEFVRPYFPRRAASRTRLPRVFLFGSIAAGLACLTIPLLLGGTDAAKAFGLVWIGFFLLLDPVNHLSGGRSILAELGMKNFQLLASLTVAGLACGVLWEFWNYWATAKWIYSVPLSIAGPRLFEMPLLGYLGFVPFACECWAMQQSLLLLFPRLARYPGIRGRNQASHPMRRPEPVDPDY